ncbi:hypothetical protein [Roseovarius albus]|uniref:hypothetical protein n=1 Tax=Roseovarius albus TaxID=1247867 RepID=UPI00117AAF1E|nr:hypothetical protein [Roseovarius albus]
MSDNNILMPNWYQDKARTDAELDTPSFFELEQFIACFNEQNAMLRCSKTELEIDYQYHNLGRSPAQISSTCSGIQGDLEGGCYA